MDALSQEQVQSILDEVMQDITNRMSEIQLSNQEAPLSQDVCTIHTTFEGGYNAILVLYADRALMTKLAQQVMQEESVAPQDVEECAREYFNVICGQVVAGLFKTAHISSRFRIPTYCVGRYVPQGNGTCLCVLNYKSEDHGGAQLIHQIPSESSEVDKTNQEGAISNA